LDIKIKRIYKEISEDDGYRVLADHLCPRGVSKEGAQPDGCNSEVTPSMKLRKWFDHDPVKFEEFRRRYKVELIQKEQELRDLIKRSGSRLTLLYTGKDEIHNHAVVLKNFLEEYF
jgi:uncharacterized protein YeaO (DUF488 family)